VSAATFRLRVEAAFGAFALSVELESSAQRLGLFGPSGAGKTSLLETVAGWRAPRAGRIEVGGRTLFDSAQGVALAPFILRARGRGARARLLERTPATPSGGERVARGHARLS